MVIGGGCSPPVLDGDSGHFALKVLGKKLIHVIYKQCHSVIILCH